MSDPHSGSLFDAPYEIFAGGANALGGKRTQEDYCVIVTNMNEFRRGCHDNIQRSYYAVFDGHGGELVSKFLAENFHILLAKNDKFVEQPIVALEETWSEAEELAYDVLKRQGRKKLSRDGSTATVCLIIAGNIYITNCGDSSAHICMQDGSHIRATEMHSTENAEEVRRCEAAGGTVRLSRNAGPRYASCWKCIKREPRPIQPRLYPGGLLVTRSFGDFHSKIESYGGLSGTLIHHHGQIAIFKLSLEIKYIVIGSDGIWDGLSPDTVFSNIDKFIARRKSSRKTVPSAISMDALGWNEKENDSNLIGKRRDMDFTTTAAAADICMDATSAPFWSKNGFSADNASCIIIRIEESSTATTL